MRSAPLRGHVLRSRGCRCLLVRTPSHLLGDVERRCRVRRTRRRHPAGDRRGFARGRIVRFQIEHRGLGVPGTDVIVHAYPQNVVSCGYTFEVGQRYIVQAYETKGVLATHMCGVVRVTEAPDELAFLREFAGPARGGRLFGLVYRTEDWRLMPPGDEGARMIPVAGARVRVTGRVSRESPPVPTACTAASKLPPGTYQFSLVPPPGLAPPGDPLPKEYRVRIDQRL